MHYNEQLSKQWFLKYYQIELFENWYTHEKKTQHISHYKHKFISKL